MQFILIRKFYFYMVFRFQSCFFLLLFLYLVDANVNHQNWIDEFPKSIYYIIVPGRCVFFSGIFFFENQMRINLFLIIIPLFH